MKLIQGLLDSIELELRYGVLPRVILWAVVLYMLAFAICL